MEDNLLLIGVIFTPLIGGAVSLAIEDNRVQRLVGLGAALLAWMCATVLLFQNVTVGPQIYRMGGWVPPFGIVLVADMLSSLFGFMATTVMVGGLLYALTAIDKCMKQRSFTTLFLFMEVGLIGGFYTGDLFTMYVFMEIMVLSSVSMVAMSDNKLGLEAAIKYLFISGMGSIFLLLGVVALYATFGTLNMAEVGQFLVEGDRPLLARTASVMLMCAFLLKSAVFPFHFWQPDFHTTAPTPVSAMLSSIVVKIGIYGIIRMVTLLYVDEAAVIRAFLLGLGLIGIYFGSLGALRTYNGKRVLAYSTFGQIGFILVGIGWSTPQNPFPLVAAILYAFNHAFIKSSLLMLFGVVASMTKTKSAALADTVGVGKSLPWIVGVLYFLGGMSLAGLPPMNGFISKLVLVRSGIETASITESAGGMWTSVGFVVAAGALTLMYMTRTWSSVFQRKPNEDTVALKEPGHEDKAYAPAMLISICLLLGIWATPLFNVVQQTVDQITNPSVYIEAVNPAKLAELEVAEGTLEIGEGD